MAALRHTLSALFEPRSLLVVSSLPLPVVRATPPSLQGRLSLASVHDTALFVPDSLQGLTAGQRLDMALICVAPRRLPQALDAIKKHRPRVVLILAADEPSHDPLEDMVYARSWARLNQCMVVGPRAFGLLRPHLGLNLSHEPQVVAAGRVALLGQSRSITSAIMDWAEDISLGFSSVLTLGDEAQLDVADVLDYLATDSRTDSVALYLEHTPSSRRFTSALYALAAVKPTVVLKVGGSRNPEEPQEAVFNALMRRVGAVRIRYFVQLFSALKVLVYARKLKGRRIALFSNGNGAAQLALEVIGPESAVYCPELSESTQAQLQQALVPGDQSANPVVSYAPLSPERIEQVCNSLISDRQIDGVLVLLAPDPLAPMSAVVQRLAQLSDQSSKPIITCLLGDADMRPLRHLLDGVGTPAFRTPDTAANAFDILAIHYYNQQLAQQTLPSLPLSRHPDIGPARELVARAQSERRGLSQQESMLLLAYFNVPLVALLPGEALTAAHFDVPPMGLRFETDKKLGPYVVFGAAGNQGWLPDSYRAVDLPPLNRYLARQLIERSPIWQKFLSRQLSAAVFTQLQTVLERVSELVCELPAVRGLSLDPLYATDEGLFFGRLQIELSAHSMLVLPETVGYGHMAIHPYPRHMVQRRQFDDGQRWVLRPVRPEDAEALQAFMRALSDETRYMRFVSMLRELTPKMLARYTRIDFDRELALVATVRASQEAAGGREDIIGFAHYLRNADGRGAEYALVVGDEWQRRGLGTELMTALIAEAREQRLTYIDGYVLGSNQAMQALMQHLGFQNDADIEDPSMRRVWLDLGETRRSD